MSSEKADCWPNLPDKHNFTKPSPNVVLMPAELSSNSHYHTFSYGPFRGNCFLSSLLSPGIQRRTDRVYSHAHGREMFSGKGCLGIKEL